MLQETSYAGQLDCLHITVRRIAYTIPLVGLILDTLLDWWTGFSFRLLFWSFQKSCYAPHVSFGINLMARDGVTPSLYGGAEIGSRLLMQVIAKNSHRVIKG